MQVETTPCSAEQISLLQPPTKHVGWAVSTAESSGTVVIFVPLFSISINASEAANTNMATVMREIKIFKFIVYYLALSVLPIKIPLAQYIPVAPAGKISYV